VIVNPANNHINFFVLVLPILTSDNLAYRMKLALLSLVGLSSIALADTSRSLLCGNERIQAPKSLASLKINARKEANASNLARRDVTTIKTFAHLVGTNETMNDDAAGRIMAQMDALNAGYKAAGFRFELAGIDRKVDAQQATTRTDADELKMKKELRKGSYADLNLYFLSDYSPSDGIGGYSTVFGMCYYPLLAPTETEFALDGCIIRQDTMPGTSRKATNLGYTVVHEVGHWLGLIHVWGEHETLDESGNQDDPLCLEDDEIADTTLQRDPTFGCPAPIGSLGPKSSCPNVDSSNNIHNYMDYTDDSCMDSFSPDQINVMGGVYDMARRGQ
jgi:hypothetical protein